MFYKSQLMLVEDRVRPFINRNQAKLCHHL